MSYGLVIMQYGYKIVEFWGDTIIWHRQGIYTGTLKSYTRFLFDVYVKMFSLTNHKMIATNKGQYIAQVLTDETIDLAVTKKRTGIANPS